MNNLVVLSEKFEILSHSIFLLFITFETIKKAAPFGAALVSNKLFKDLQPTNT